MKYQVIFILLFCFQSLFSQVVRDEILPYQGKKKWGYVDYNLRTVIPEKFNYALRFEHGINYMPLV